MKKSHHTLWLASVAAAVVLSACGSGGSGSGVSSTTTPIANPSKPTTPATPATPTTPVVTEFKQAGYNSNGTVSTNLAVATSDGAKYTYQYAGKTLDVTMPNVKSGTVVSTTDGSGLTTTVGGTGYSYSRFGAIFAKGQALPAQVFSVGVPTSDMPTTGSAQYKGLLLGNGMSSERGAFYTQFDVSFANKTLTGLGSTVDGVKVFEFRDGKILGNTFAGVFAQPAAETEGTFAGQFFGPNAAELGGYAHMEDGYTLSFGAKKQ